MFDWLIYLYDVSIYELIIIQWLKMNCIVSMHLGIYECVCRCAWRSEGNLWGLVLFLTCRSQGSSSGMAAVPFPLLLKWIVSSPFSCFLSELGHSQRLSPTTWSKLDHRHELFQISASCPFPSESVSKQWLCIHWLELCLVSLTASRLASQCWILPVFFPSVCPASGLM